MTVPDMTQTSGPGRWFTPRAIVMTVFALILALIVAGALWWVFTSMGKTKIDATFARTVGIYKGTDVRVLGVKVGEVDEVTPKGDKVEVKMSVDRGIDLPKDVKAVQVVPSIVADRYVQLTPVFTKGMAKAPKSFSLSVDKQQTMVPVEVDELYRGIQNLTDALGPNGANKPGTGEQEGALTKLARIGADNLEGNGAKLGETIEKLSEASQTLAGSSGDIVSTIKNLDLFVGALRENDTQVRQFNSQMATFSKYMVGEREQLGQALNKLSYALGDVATFLDDNEQKLGKTVRDLQPTTKALADQKDNLKEVLTVLPLTISNLINAYNAESGTLDMRLTIPQLQDLLGAGCSTLDLGKLMPGDPAAKQWSATMRPLVQNCSKVAKQITKGVLEPTLPILPFGIMSNDKLQQKPAPGTTPGNSDPQLKQTPPSQRGGN
ncbi:MCE family protein [Gordonia amarae]|uniref:Mce family protein n=2 Tax=Gordonia amarae TaxID=36821 RepID=G7GQS8_9ACTN|nr:MCE family protein [Gordonia amarae]MCS3877628.1 virulence factor Mce-like protein [Gordonia amarae]QHN16342.1 MCE family protein [Gordonia amarae]QHN20911.1 MCE family protein [Gordonia amarae]QHN29762.1 MCE family protein [Gordonia amarae]QHN38537.1 MCE family protein [Gordonia amarae]